MNRLFKHHIGLLIVAVITEIIGLLQYVRNSEIRKCFEYKNCFEGGVEILSAFEVSYFLVNALKKYFIFIYIILSSLPLQLC